MPLTQTQHWLIATTAVAVIGVTAAVGMTAYHVGTQQGIASSASPAADQAAAERSPPVEPSPEPAPTTPQAEAAPAPQPAPQLSDWDRGHQDGYAYGYADCDPSTQFPRSTGPNGIDPTSQYGQGYFWGYSDGLVAAGCVAD